MRPASDKQLNLIYSMVPWLETFGENVEFLSHDDIPTLNEASKWISDNMDAYKKLKDDHSTAELWGKQGMDA